MSDHEVVPNGGFAVEGLKESFSYPLVRGLALYRFLDGLVLVYPLYQLLWGAEFGSFSIPLAFALVFLAGLILEIPTGILADRVDRRLVLMGAAIAKVAALAIWTLAASDAGVVVGLVLWGASRALASGTFEALLYEELRAHRKERDYLQAQGIARAAFLFAAGTALLVAFLLDDLEMQVQLLRAALLASVATTVVISLLPLESDSRSPQSVTAKSPVAILRLALLSKVLRLLLAAVAVAGLATTWFYDLSAGFDTDVLDTSGIALITISLWLSALASLMAERIGQSITKAPIVLLMVAGVMLVFTALMNGGGLAFALLPAYAVAVSVAVLLADAGLQHRLPSGPRATITSLAAAGARLLSLLYFLLYAVLRGPSESQKEAIVILGFAVTVLAGALFFISSRTAKTSPVSSGSRR